VDGDGLLDVVVANTWVPWDNQIPIFVEPYVLNDHNQLFKNIGNGHFVNVSEASGLEDTTGFNPPADGEATITWVMTLVDIDLDGDLDVVQADDQAGVPSLAQGGVDRGFIHIFENDGTGHFTDVTVAKGLNKQGQWMGLAFGDLNCDGYMDMFGSNLGDYVFPLLNPAYQRGESASRWFLGHRNGTFADPGVGDLIATPFGWGAAVIDYDNDGDSDIIYHGGFGIGPFVDASNPGAILENEQCSGNFSNVTSVAGSQTDHLRRNVQGVAIGDFNDDGFPDVVSVSNQNHPVPIPLAPFPVTYGSTFDSGGFVPMFTPTGPGTFEWSGIVPTDGDLSVELNSADNGNTWIKVDVVGTKGLTAGGVVNRDGIGAVISVTPRHGHTSMKPVTAGSSYASSNSDVLSFGYAQARRGQVDVLWPGGVKNRLYGVKKNRTQVFPEIPCSYDDQTIHFSNYVRCVAKALHQVRREHVINLREKNRFFVSSVIAWFDAH
jgi:hypothetical protein